MVKIGDKLYYKNQLVEVIEIYEPFGFAEVKEGNEIYVVDTTDLHEEIKEDNTISIDLGWFI